MKFILGTKVGMTQVFGADGRVIPVTKVQAGPCIVTQVKIKEKDGFNAIQIGFGEQKLFRLKKPQQGHLQGVSLSPDGSLAVRVMRELPTGDEAPEVRRGDVFGVKIFQTGEKIAVQGISKGKGFQGVVKRHGFAGSPATHGHKDQLRMPGSIGAGGVQRVFKGQRMAGQMGNQQVTVKNLEIVAVEAEKNELLIKGAVPGARGSLLLVISPEGKIIADKIEEAKPETVELKIGSQNPDKAAQSDSN